MDELFALRDLFLKLTYFLFLLDQNVQLGEITSAFSLFPFRTGVSASLNPPLFSLSLSVTPPLSLFFPLALPCYFCILIQANILSPNTLHIQMLSV